MNASVEERVAVTDAVRRELEVALRTCELAEQALRSARAAHARAAAVRSYGWALLPVELMRRLLAQVRTRGHIVRALRYLQLLDAELDHLRLARGVRLGFSGPALQDAAGGEPCDSALARTGRIHAELRAALERY